MTIQLPPLAAAYVQATNQQDAAAFLRLFDDNAVVNDAGREFRGREAIKEWSESDIFAANVTLEVTAAKEEPQETVVTTKVDGTFDKTGLPDPLFIDQHLQFRDGKIAALACRLVTA
ncbi:SnoaL-like domain protein [Anatilimnocola aggregata]|uniref:SnoaL-like domain protein n=1 Tax=Anatilimnocola aggregata TaxID=2528021 RepID=A0A517Y8B7_9BACT|nr:nuclear transport factor 2 family protein [Anatilimnocola aggregata]QDU26488.1 SnoaL-like domain protein [Anatilimnocola aggregata]